MKQLKVSNNVIRRLPRYLRKLDELKTAGVDRISSGELGRQMSLTSSQIRQDFSCFGEFGQQGYGYNVTGLRGEIASILGMNRDFSVILVGVGNIGRALIENFCFEQYGFHMLAAYDVRPELVGTDISGIRVHDISELPHIFDNNKVDMAVLSVPKIMANKAAHELVDHGVKAIWNFTNVELASPRARSSWRTSTSPTACSPSATTSPSASTPRRPPLPKTRNDETPRA